MSEDFNVPINQFLKSILYRNTISCVKKQVTKISLCEHLE